MKAITTSTELKEQISILENKKALQEVELKKGFEKAYDRMKPINLIKSGFSELTSSSEIKGSLIDLVLGLGAGYISKKILVGTSKNPLKELLGGVLQGFITSGVAKNSESIKTTIKTILQDFLTKKDNHTDEQRA